MTGKREFEEFFKDNYEDLYFFALHIIGDEETAKDIVSNAFEHAWKKNSSFSTGSQKIFMLFYIRNKCIDHIRHKSVSDKYVDFCMRTMSESVREYEEREEQLQQIAANISKLSPKTRLVLQECYINKKRYREVAEELDISVNTVKKHIVSALKFLRKNIVKNNYD